MLFLVFLMMTLGLFALFLGGGLVGVGYLYQNPADRMPIRRDRAALVAAFVTFWVWVDQRAPGVTTRSSTSRPIPRRSSTSSRPFAGWPRAAKSASTTRATTSKRRRRSQPQQRQVLRGGTPDREFLMEGYTADGRKYLTGAIRVKGPDDPEPVLYNA